MKERTKGQRKKITDGDIQRWVMLYDEGKSYARIAALEGRHWQTVRKYVAPAIKDREGNEIRRELLKSAVARHHEQLRQFVEGFQLAFSIPDGVPLAEFVQRAPFQPQDLPLRERLLYQALRQVHAADSPLWRDIEDWTDAARELRDTLRFVKEEIADYVRKGTRSLPDLRLEPTFQELLVEHAIRVAYGYSVSVPSQLEVRQGPGGWELWQGKATLMACASSSREATQARNMFESLASKIETGTGVKALREYYDNLLRCRDDVERDCQILILRGVFPGKCELCPI